MDAEEIDRKIEEVGSEKFEDSTRNWLTSILTKHHTNGNHASASSNNVALALPMAPTDCTSGAQLNGAETASPGTSSSTSTSSSPSSGGDARAKPRSVHSVACPEVKRPAVNLELITYTMGNLVSRNPLAIPHDSTVLGFKATYALSTAETEKQDITKSLIVKLIDDDEDWDDYVEEDKENQVLPSSKNYVVHHNDLYNPNMTEYNFYVKLVPEIEAWAASRGVPFKFGVPHCTHGQYFPSTHSRKSPFLLDSLSTVVLDDLIENEGYRMKNPGIEGLAVEELKLAFVEAAKMHAVSWAFQECIGVSLKDKYNNFFEDLCEQAVDFAEDIEESIPELEAFFKGRGGPDATRLLGKLTSGMLPRIREVVQECFIPTDSPQPMLSLVHTNFWHQNLLFKNTSAATSHRPATDGESDDEESPTLAAHVPAPAQAPGRESSCRILSWENMNVSQPMIDPACLLFRSASPKARREHVDELIRLYSSTFQSTAQFLGIPTVYDSGYFKRQYQKCAIYPIFMVMGTMELALGDDTALELFLEGLLDCEADHLP